MKITTLNKIPKGGFFRRLRSGAPAGTTYIRGDYDRDARKFDANSVDDAWGTGIQLKGTTRVATGETY